MNGVTMYHEVVQQLLQAIAVMLTTVMIARISGLLFARVGLPDLIGALAAGIICGPLVLGLVAINSDALTATLLSEVANVGLVLLMIVGGLSLGTGGQKGEQRDVLAWIAATTVAFVLAYVTASNFQVSSVASGQTGARNPHLIVMALAVVVTSVPFLTKVFMGLDLLHTSLARRVLQAACIIDLGVWSVYPLTTIKTSQEIDYALQIGASLLSTITFLASIWMTAILLQHIRCRLHGDKNLIDVALVFFLGAVCFYLANQLNVHIMIASFFFGYSAKKVCDVNKWKGTLDVVANGFFIPIYFAVIGASLVSLRVFDLDFIFCFLIWSFLIKGSCDFAACYFLRFPNHLSLVISVVLNTRGGPGISLAAIAFTDNIIDDTTFVTFVIVSLITTVISHFALKWNKEVVLDLDK